MLNSPVARQDYSKSKNKIDDHRSKCKKQIQASVLQFSITEVEKWNDAFHHPEKNKSSCNQKSTGERRDVFKKIDYGVHQKRDQFFNNKLAINDDPYKLIIRFLELRQAIDYMSA